MQTHRIDANVLGFEVKEGSRAMECIWNARTHDLLEPPEEPLSNWHTESLTLLVTSRTLREYTCIVLS